MLNRLLPCLLLLLSPAALTAQRIISAQQLNYHTIDDISAQFPGTNPVYDVSSYKVLYRTVDVKGDSTIASGILYIPLGCNALPLAVYQHGTIFNRNTVPSAGYEEVGLGFAGQGFVSVAPDYLGMGENTAHVHPYLHAPTQATAALDLIRAGREYVVDTIGLSMNGEVFITGYSQGGHAAMGLHRYIEENNLLNEFNVVASAPLSGPYYLSEMVHQVLTSGTYAVPSYLPYLIEGMQAAYGDIYTDLSEVYKLPYRNYVANYLSGTWTYNSVASFLPNNFSLFLADSFLQAITVDSIPPYTTNLRKAIARNDNHNWVPTRPVRMIYCTGDEQVYPFNAIAAYDTMLAYGASGVDTVRAAANVTHGICYPYARDLTISWFNSLRTPCGPLESIAGALKDAWSFFPNPGRGEFVIDLRLLAAGKPLTCEVFDLHGKRVAGTAAQTGLSTPISLSQLAPGAYLIKVSGDGFFESKLFEVMP